MKSPLRKAVYGAAAAIRGSHLTYCSDTMLRIAQEQADALGGGETGP